MGEGFSFLLLLLINCYFVGDPFFLRCLLTLCSLSSSSFLKAECWVFLMVCSACSQPVWGSHFLRLILNDRSLWQNSQMPSTKQVKIMIATRTILDSRILEISVLVVISSLMLMYSYTMQRYRQNKMTKICMPMLKQLKKSYLKGLSVNKQIRNTICSSKLGTPMIPALTKIRITNLITDTTKVQFLFFQSSASMPKWKPSNSWKWADSMQDFHC